VAKARLVARAAVRARLAARAAVRRPKAAVEAAVGTRRVAVGAATEAVVAIDVVGAPDPDPAIVDAVIPALGPAIAVVDIAEETVEGIVIVALRRGVADLVLPCPIANVTREIEKLHPKAPAWASSTSPTTRARKIWKKSLVVTDLWLAPTSCTTEPPEGAADSPLCILSIWMTQRRRESVVPEWRSTGGEFESTSP